MKKLILLLVIFFAIQNVLADDPIKDFLYTVNPEIDCPASYAKNGEGSSEVELNTCTQEALERTDGELNTVYKKLFAYYKQNDKNNAEKTELAQQLKEAQRSWIKFRDAQCQVVYFTFFGGNAASSKENLCHLTLTKNRVDELKKFQIWDN